MGQRQRPERRARAEDPRLEGVGQGTSGERTLNICSMVVTSEVSQLEISALKFSILRKSSSISVMPETSQSAILPNFFSVVPGFSLKSSTATFSEALSVKVPSGGASGGEGGASGGHFFSTHFLSFFSAALSFFSAFLTFFSSLEHLEHFFLSPPASTPVARRSEMRSKVMSFIVCALCVRVYLRTKAMAHDRTRAGGKGEE